MMNFVSKMRAFALKTRNCVLKTRNRVSKMMTFAVAGAETAAACVFKCKNEDFHIKNGDSMLTKC